MTLNELRLAAIAFTRAHDKHGAMVQFGAGVAQARVDLAGATKALVRAGDLHATRGDQTIAELVREGHTIQSAKRLFEVRGQKRRQNVRRKFKAAEPPRKTKR